MPWNSFFAKKRATSFPVHLKGAPASSPFFIREPAAPQRTGSRAADSRVALWVAVFTFSINRLCGFTKCCILDGKKYREAEVKLIRELTGRSEAAG